MTLPLRGRFAMLAAALVLLVASLVGLAGYLTFQASVLSRARTNARTEVTRLIASVGAGGAGDGQSVDLTDPSLTRQLASPGVLVEVERPNGAIVQAVPTMRHGPPIALPAAVRERCLASGRAQIRLSRPALQVACGRVGPAARPLGVIAAGVPLRDSLASLVTLRRTLVLGVLGGVVLAAFLSLLIAGRALRPLRRIALTAEKIRSGDLGRRIGYRGRDEVGEVADVLDACFEELEQAIERQRRFAADASHELKTPLGAIRANVELLRGWAATDPAARDTALASLEQATRRASHLVVDLLTLVRLDRDSSRRQMEVRLDEAVLGAVREAATLRSDVAIRVDRLAEATTLGDPIGLQQLLLNVLDNALRVSPPQSQVAVALTTDEHVARVSISDAGPGINPTQLERIFDRFYTRRVGPDATSGAGLGLAIARSIARAHGGDLVADNDPEGGATFRLTVPTSRKDGAAGSNAGALPRTGVA